MAQIDGRAFEELRDAFWGADPGMEGPGAAGDTAPRAGARPGAQAVPPSRVATRDGGRVGARSDSRNGSAGNVRPFVEGLGRRLRIQEVPRPVLVAVVALAATALLLGALLAGRARMGEVVTRGTEAGEGEAAASSRVAGGDGSACDGLDGSGGLPSVGGFGAARDAAPSETDPAEEEPGLIVHVAGCVASPGVYGLASGARVVDAIEAAGGLTPDADVGSVNLAEPVADGCKVSVPSVYDEDGGAAPGGSAPVVSYTSGSGAAAGNPSGLVDINAADAAELCTLPGVGDATAAEIVRDREANGPFASVEDLMRVSGIGEKKFARLKDLVCV